MEISMKEKRRIAIEQCALDLQPTSDALDV